MFKTRQGPGDFIHELLLGNLGDGIRTGLDGGNAAGDANGDPPGKDWVTPKAHPPLI